MSAPAPDRGPIRSRRKTRSVRVGSIALGSDHPIRVQTMTKGDTGDVEKTFLSLVAKPSGQ